MSKPKGKKALECPECGEFTLRKVDGLKGYENVIGLILFAFILIPGIAYYFDRTRLPWCSTCKKRVPI